MLPITFILQYIREIQLMLDTSVALMQNYHTIIARLPPYVPESSNKTTDDQNQETDPSTSQVNEPSTSRAASLGDTLENTIQSGPNDEIRRRRLRHFENTQ